jgi:hypothetical protein
MRDVFSTMEQSSEKNSDLRSQANCEDELAGVKGQDERQNTAPLTPANSPADIPTLFFRKRAEKQH